MVLLEGIRWQFNNGCVDVLKVRGHDHIVETNRRNLHRGNPILRNAIDFLTVWRLNQDLLALFEHGLLLGENDFWREGIAHLLWIRSKILLVDLRLHDILQLAIHIHNLLLLPNDAISEVIINEALIVLVVEWESRVAKLKSFLPRDVWIQIFWGLLLNVVDDVPDLFQLFQNLLLCIGFVQVLGFFNLARAVTYCSLALELSDLLVYICHQVPLVAFDSQFLCLTNLKLFLQRVHGDLHLINFLTLIIFQ